MAELTIPSPNHSGRGGAAVIWLAVHTAEGATTAVSLANFLANPKNQVSYHDVCDDSTTVHCVDYTEKSWSMLGGNPRSDQVCCTGFAAWSRETWLSHEGMLDRIARWLAARARVRGIPLEHIGPQGVANRTPGVIGHGDYTIGAHEGTHTDPGPNFPWDYVITKARRIAGNRTGEGLMSQGNWEPCTKDSSGNIISKRGYLCAPVGKASLLVQRGWFSLGTGWDAGADCDVAFYDDSGKKLTGGGRFLLPVNQRRFWNIPDGATQIQVDYRSLNPIGWCIELEAR